MSDNKKYYYLKLKENFFDSDDMILLESMENGYLYSNILLKLYLRSLKHEGKLMYKERIPYNPSMLAKVTRHNVDVVEKALKIFKELDIIQILDNGAMYMLDMQDYIGKGSTEGERKSRYRARIKSEQQLLSGTLSQDCPEICPPEIIKDKEKIDINTYEEAAVTIILTPEEAEFLNILQSIKNYPFDRVKDLELFKNLGIRYPNIDLIESIRDWAIYKEDKPLKTKDNPRSQINTSFKKYSEWGKNPKQTKVSDLNEFNFDGL